MFKRQTTASRAKPLRHFRARKRIPTARDLDEAFHFATRVFYRRVPATGVWFEIRDRMVRTAEGQFYLIEDHPIKLGGHEVARPYSLASVFAWLQDSPQQIERTVVKGG
ncbi:MULTISPECIES: hypothetical protein [Bradyrhizobium]|uniref:hypothetical protein n=1 Tax=Bradyrhizobium TaxID=374 RepID=UPI00114D3BE7|nr:MULTISPECIES: hypothetical protein [Bradyrhizobium]MCA1544700.1 hypothetical protein [Bradyrhizobium sp. NBAIM32]